MSLITPHTLLNHRGVPPMPNTYAVGYGGATMTRAQLLKWRHYERLEDEFGRRILALMDASNAAGKPVSIGSSCRTTEGQTKLFLSRHHEAAPTERACCRYQGKRYALNKGAAHAAPPGLSYHEDSVLPSGECLASDLIGNMNYVVANAAKYGLRHFGDKGEKWHVQPIELPAGRSSFRLGMMPLPVFDLPGQPDPQPQRVEAPVPNLTVEGDVNNVNNRAEVRELQAMCNFFRWRDASGAELDVDGRFGKRTAEAVKTMQTALGVHVDGEYGPRTAKALQAFLDRSAP